MASEIDNPKIEKTYWIYGRLWFSALAPCKKTDDQR